MPKEDVIQKLGRFHPQPVDRDRLLFETGRASVRLNPIWKRATLILLLTQTLTLAYIGYWHLHPPTLAQPVPLPTRSPVPTTIDLPPPVPIQQPPTNPSSERPFPHEQMLTIWRLEHNPDALKSHTGYVADSRGPTLSLWNRDYQP